MKKVLFLGAGKMGGAILSKLLSSNFGDCSFYIVDPGLNKDAAEELSVCEIYANLSQCLEKNLRFDVVFLSVKPQIFENSSLSFDQLIHPKTVVISVMAGISCQTISKVMPETSEIIRCMPNVGALNGHSASVSYCPSHVTENSRCIAENLMTQVGSFAWVESEDLMHAVTGLSGSGPAYFFAFVEAMREAGTGLGLNAALADQLAIDTMIGAAELLKVQRDPTALRVMVTSPNGTTQAALDAFSHDDAMRCLVRHAMSAAVSRSVELSGKK
ncbi:pyrroline-5-carboxylate reductase [Aliamphritea hakodatensis]|uniref:pyrroline-5-carboxylate reductase n=1 Tax=Aliamphritea hakodatensis TaxID=2895352 RepID=UPI0022FD6B6C|nr:pyrroline-5-carboxylate reductase [Aliamphritea hakodatensis]